MSMKLHIAKTYRVEYADNVISKYNEAIVNMARHSDYAWINDDETEIEIQFSAIKNEMANTFDQDWYNYLQYILDNADRNNDYVHFSIF